MPSPYPNNNHARDGFADNHTTFGKILRGELPANILHEDEQTLCFRDISPASDLHVLIIPKKLIQHFGCCEAGDAPLLRHMEAVALKVLQAEYPSLDIEAARADGTASLGYHKWPLITVYHLHLHLIYPLPISWTRPFHKLIFPQSYGMFYESSTSVIEGCEAKRSEQ